MQASRIPFGAEIHPELQLSVPASWQTVDLPVHRGRIPAGEELDQVLHRALEQEPEVPRRQLIVLDCRSRLVLRAVPRPSGSG